MRSTSIIEGRKKQKTEEERRTTVALREELKAEGADAKLLGEISDETLNDILNGFRALDKLRRQTNKYGDI